MSLPTITRPTNQTLHKRLVAVYKELKDIRAQPNLGGLGEPLCQSLDQALGYVRRAIWHCRKPGL